MIVINITDGQGILLGTTTLTHEDKSQNGVLHDSWIGEKILSELPSDTAALNKLLDTQEVDNG